MAFRLGWSSPLDERFDFERGDGSRNSPFEVERFTKGVGFMMEKIKENIYVFYKKKDTNMKMN
jgi:hypothetical protein